MNSKLKKDTLRDVKQPLKLVFNAFFQPFNQQGIVSNKYEYIKNYDIAILK